MNKANWTYLGIGAGAILLIGIIIYLIFKIVSLNDAIEEEKKKAQLWSDSLKTVVTELGEVYEKHALEMSLQTNIISQLHHNLQWALSLASQAQVVESEKGDTLFAFHEPIYKDSGAVIEVKDSIWFVKNEKDEWISKQKMQLKGEVFLEQTVGRDSTGNFFGRVETKSKALKLTLLNTQVNNNYNPKTTFKVSSSPPARSILGVTADIDFQSFAGGVAFNIGNYQFSTKYILISQNFSEKPLWYERLRFGGVYYIW